MRSSQLLHFDGRLDNRADLLLLLRDCLHGDTSDAALALATYERWGIDGLARLIGDWSLVFRDVATGARILASDYAGVRPLYYHVQLTRVLWSSRLQTLVKATGISDLDDDYVRGFLLYGACPNRTPYRGIYSVPPGHAVCVSNGNTTIRRFWSLPTGDRILYRDRRQYEEQLRALFREAVAVRLQSDAPVLSELSGGLDSSSVVCMANEMIRAGAAPAPSLTTVSFLWRNSLDEPFIREVESHCGIEGIHISTHEVPLAAEPQAGSAMPEQFQPLRTSVAAAARRLGASTMLTGQGGDLIMGNWFDDSLQVAASLRRLRIGRACKESLAWSKVLRRPIYQVLGRAIGALFPPAMAPAAIYTGADGSYTPKSTETSLTYEPQSPFTNTWMQAPPERRKHFRALTTILELRALQAPEPLQHLDYTHPYAHRPMVEFLMMVPANVLCGPAEPRKLMRSALSHLWPTRLRARRSKGSFNLPWQEALRPVARTLLNGEELQVVDRGFVDGDSVRSRLQRLSTGLDCNEGQLRQIVLLELWLRNCLADRPCAQWPRAA